MNRTDIKNSESLTLEVMRSHVHSWESDLEFINDELFFIDRLLNSYVFEPNTLNSFQKIEDYLMRLQKIKHCKNKITIQISTHLNQLGGILESTDAYCDESSIKKHRSIENQVHACVTDFKTVKSEVFKYASGILKQRKPS